MKIKQLFFAVSLLFAPAMFLFAMQEQPGLLVDGVVDALDAVHIADKNLSARTSFTPGIDIMAIATRHRTVALFFLNTALGEGPRFSGFSIAPDLGAPITRLHINEVTKVMTIDVGDKKLRVDLNRFILFDTDTFVVHTELRKELVFRKALKLCVQANSDGTRACVCMMFDDRRLSGLCEHCPEALGAVITSVDAIAYEPGHYLIAFGHSDGDMALMIFDAYKKKGYRVQSFKYCKGIASIILGSQENMVTAQIVFADGEEKIENIVDLSPVPEHETVR